MTDRIIRQAERSDQFRRLVNQRDFPEAFTECPGCRDGRRGCAVCAGTRKVSHATAREMASAVAA